MANIRWAAPKKAKPPIDKQGRQIRGFNKWNDWNIFTGTIETRAIPHDIPITPKARKHWETNRDDFTGFVNVRGFTETDVISVISAAKRGEASVTVNRWGFFAFFKIKEGKWAR